MGGGCLGGPKLTPGGVFKFCSSFARNTVYVREMVPTTNTAPTHHGGVLLSTYYKPVPCSPIYLTNAKVYPASESIFLAMFP